MSRLNRPVIDQIPVYWAETHANETKARNKATDTTEITVGEMGVPIDMLRRISLADGSKLNSKMPRSENLQTRVGRKGYCM